MPPTATDGVTWPVCVCFLITFASHAKTAEPIKMPFGGLTRVGPRNYVLDGVEIPHEKGQFWGLSDPLKSTGSLLRCTLQRDKPVLNNGTTCDASCGQNSLTTCLKIILRCCNTQNRCKYGSLNHMTRYIYVRYKTDGRASLI